MPHRLRDLRRNGQLKRLRRLRDRHDELVAALRGVIETCRYNVEHAEPVVADALTDVIVRLEVLIEREEEP